MGLYTNPSFSGYASSNYTSVEPFKGEHFNYHELGIMAAAESAANRNAFMKAIALNELASMEQYGTDQVFYESVNISGIFEKIKAFFKKIIEKIHKILHTFMAKLSSWFQSSKDFAKKYEKEIIKKWGLVKNDWEFKGYIFTNLDTDSDNADFIEDIKDYTTWDNDSNTDISDAIKNIVSSKSGESLTNNLQAIITLFNDNPVGTKEALAKARDNLDNTKDKLRAGIINRHSGGNSKSTTLDSKEFTEELFKLFRNNEDSKVDVKLSELGSASDVVSFIKNYDKIKSSIEKNERTLVKSIDDLIDAISKAQNDLIKKNNDKNTDKGKKDANEIIVQVSSFYQSIIGFVKECETQAFSAELQAQKDKCIQYKEVCVKVISSSKKMTEESVDYSNYSGNFNSFIENVKLV